MCSSIKIKKQNSKYNILYLKQRKNINKFSHFEK